MVGVEKHLPNMASSQVIKPPAFKSPSRAPGNNCSFLCLSSKVGGGGGRFKYDNWDFKSRHQCGRAAYLSMDRVRNGSLTWLSFLISKRGACGRWLEGAHSSSLPSSSALHWRDGRRLRTSRGCYIKPFRNLTQASYSIASGDSFNWVHAVHNCEMFLFTAWFQIIQLKRKVLNTTKNWETIDDGSISHPL